MTYLNAHVQAIDRTTLIPPLTERRYNCTAV